MLKPNLLKVMALSKLANQARNSELLQQAHALQFLISLLSRKDFLDHFHVPKKSLLVDTTDFLNLIEHFNIIFSPIPKHVILVTWDIEAMYPSIHVNNKIGLQACRKILDSREVLKLSTDCLMNAIKITLDNNSSTFNNTHYLQTDGTAMDPKNACSYADVSVSKIGKVFQSAHVSDWGGHVFSLLCSSLKNVSQL